MITSSKILNFEISHWKCFQQEYILKRSARHQALSCSWLLLPKSNKMSFKGRGQVKAPRLKSSESPGNVKQVGVLHWIVSWLLLNFKIGNCLREPDIQPCNIVFLYICWTTWTRHCAKMQVLCTSSNLSCMLSFMILYHQWSYTRYMIPGVWLL